jgi:hypothetical protein
MSSRTVYVRLLNEAVDVWRPVEAVDEGHDVFRIVGPQTDADEEWEFPSGSLVRCTSKSIEGEEDGLVAYALVDS